MIKSIKINLKTIKLLNMRTSINLSRRKIRVIKI